MKGLEDLGETKNVLMSQDFFMSLPVDRFLMDKKKKG